MTVVPRPSTVSAVSTGPFPSLRSPRTPSTRKDSESTVWPGVAITVIRRPAASMTSPSVSGPPRPRRNPLPTERTVAPVNSTSLSIPPVWSSCLWLISTSGILPRSASLPMCSSSSGPGSTITISSLPGPRSTQVLVPSSVMMFGLLQSSTEAVTVSVSKTGRNIP